ncbi:MAG: hypothetical protein N2559_08620 [Anaerolineae bacterium]|nr:hypothetical protein [Anaerolineae bacterium]
MIISEVERELLLVKQTLYQLQIAVERLGARLGASPTTPTTPTIQWLSLIGMGKEIWQDVDVDTYVKAERDTWN